MALEAEFVLINSSADVLDATESQNKWVFHKQDF